ncbi:MAG: AmmeMemoRadiSam system protein B [Spirochaetaceae bacterium]|jgi:AmmeMemoRadiSam system protein B|nr:AmmeMemoRadiSam system protein B [Spirochaetaceae bacterium]
MVRKMMLPPGWYPRDAEAIDGYLGGFLASGGGARAVIAPHAGWLFSGRIAAKALSALRRDTGLVIVAGGHLPAGHPALFFSEDAVATPLGEMPVDREMRALVREEFLRAGLDCGADDYADNTVEVLLPAVRRFFPGAALLALRLGADRRAFEAGALVAAAAASLGRAAVLVGSTDLTHYGPSYGFCPAGHGKTALDWVKTVNDRRLIEALLSGDGDAVLERAAKEHSACSAGAVLCAMGFASGVRAPMTARLLDYTTSADVQRALGGGYGEADSFVGYAAVELD